MDVAAPAIELHGARKTYRRWRKPPEKALDGLDLVVEEGGVFGFLGPNGSGKTTTIRLLLGLAAADGGQVRVFGQDVPRHLPNVVGQVGALVESPLFLPGLTGRDSLRLLARSQGIPDRRVEEVLDLVRLRERAGDRFKGYSLGMRQRLGIAAALLKDPRLLILDEPSNGLDPAGMKEVRELVRDLGASGITVFLSSHLLGEVQQVCDRMAILSRGRCLVTGDVREVLTSRAGHGIRVGLADAAAGARVLQERGYDVAHLPDGALGVSRSGGPVGDPAEVTRVLGEHGLWVRELTAATVDLESVFLDLTAGQGLGDDTGAGTDERSVA